MAWNANTYSTVLGLGLMTFACGGSTDDGLFAGGSGTDAGRDSAVGGTSSGGASSGGASSGGASSGGASSGGASSGGASSGGAAGDGASGGVAGAGTGAAGAGGVATGGTGGGQSGGSGGTGAVPALGSCFSHCGKENVEIDDGGDGCFCDHLCEGEGDCCNDYKTVCGPAPAGQVNCLTAGSCPICCMSGEGSPYGEQCVASPTACTQAVVACDGPEDCAPGTVCCGQRESGAWTSFTCRAGNQCNTSATYLICGSNPGVCTGGDDCVTSQVMPQIRFCN